MWQWGTWFGGDGLMFGVDDLSCLSNLNDYTIWWMQGNQTFGKFIIAIAPKPLGLVSWDQLSPAFRGHQASLEIAFSQEIPSKSVPVVLLAGPLAPLFGCKWDTMEPWNHLSGKGPLEVIWSNSAATKTNIYSSISLLRAPSFLPLNISMDGTSTISLGNLCQCFTALIIKSFDQRQHAVAIWRDTHDSL